MSGRIIASLSVLLCGLALSLTVAATPTPTPTPKKSFFSNFKPRVNPSATAPRTGAAVGRGAHLGIDRSAQTPTPKPTSAPKSRSSASARKSPKPSATSFKTAKSPSPSTTATPQSTSSPKKETSPEEQLPRILSTPAESISPSPTSAPTATATTTPKPTPSVTATATPTPTATASVSPRPRPTKVELTLTKFQPQHGSPGDRDYRAAQLSYRINVPNRMEYPTINFTVETSSGKLFERMFQLPSGSAFVEPDENIEHTVALDPVARDDWRDAYAKTDRATFSWSIEGQSSGSTEKSVKKPWP